ncbi:hypothetical protein MFUM_910006 [Methylacidiphilum fumariolicum SolV]|uniref:Uncharacterized protein n=2 Tax=Candidatus Methylacidiphilum fumarolicum TaxID=591154 RepID=I0K0P4_METFB|nr:conserved protein of unknown function [Candidatus Methylacidiphilum fumarolicum]CCG93063.1 hypothetical protein MFUM_910006 [Methylacidiphilum fumariolicum SolV]
MSYYVNTKGVYLVSGLFSNSAIMLNAVGARRQIIKLRILSLA